VFPQGMARWFILTELGAGRGTTEGPGSCTAYGLTTPHPLQSDTDSRARHGGTWLQSQLSEAEARRTEVKASLGCRVKSRLKKRKLGTVAHIYTPNYPAGRDQKDQCSRPAWAKLGDPIWKITNAKWSGVAQVLESLPCKC
jgi:hypothetical protein